MARTYILDTKAAIEANSSQLINTSGKYKGEIVFCYYDKNKNGTESVNLLFKDETGKRSPVLTLFTHNGNGEQLYGYSVLNALMTCCRVKTLTSASESINLYDYNAKKETPQTKEVYVELKNKPVGLVLQQEEYQKNDGNIGTKLTLIAPFEASTELMASEILHKVTEPTSLSSIVANLAANPIKRLKVHTSNEYGYQSSQQAAVPDFDDDIPF